MSMASRWHGASKRRILIIQRSIFVQVIMADELLLERLAITGVFFVVPYLKHVSGLFAVQRNN